MTVFDKLQKMAGTAREAAKLCGMCDRAWFYMKKRKSKLWFDQLGNELAAAEVLRRLEYRQSRSMKEVK